MAAAPNDDSLTDSASLLEASGLAKHFGPVVALRSANLRVRGGEIHALMGANGAGKSTLVKILTGALTADGGTIRLGGRALRLPGPFAAARPHGAAEPDTHGHAYLELQAVSRRSGAGRVRPFDHATRARPANPKPARPGTRAGNRTAAAAARRDHGVAARRPDLSRVQRRAAAAHGGTLGDLHLTPSGGGFGVVRPRHGAAGREDGRCRRTGAGRRGAHCQADAWPGGGGGRGRGSLAEHSGDWSSRGRGA
ncbi:MAG: ATP-binding cassette domain-containing protein [Chloroflexi bacterium]|nr:MAG: ATP-binding cassette domain-containing protein [Chloroflexota bacterium]